MSTESTTSRLLDFVGLYELTKNISRHASDVELMSMNALIANKSAGTHSGFSAVAENLRLFSIDVIDNTQRLSQEFTTIISTITDECNLTRRARIIHDTREKTPAAAIQIRPSTQRIHTALTRSSVDFHRLVTRVNHMLDRIHAYCLVGSGLSVSGKIESMYLGELGRMVYAISHDIWAIVNSIFGIVSDIKDRINGYAL